MKDISFVLVLFFHGHVNTAFCFYIHGPLQVITCDPWHCFDAVEMRWTQIDNNIKVAII